MNWYKKYIEPEIRDIVKLLRDNGVNTESSCGHKMYVKFQVLDIEEIEYVDEILVDAGYINFYIECFSLRTEGWKCSSATVYFPVNNDYPVQTEQVNALEQYYMNKNKDKNE